MHETVHTFHVLGENSNLHYDAILGKDFLEEKRSVIDYFSRQLIIENEITVNFDPKPSANKLEPCRLTVRDRTEDIVEIPTSSKGLGLLPKGELSPGVYIASSLNMAVKGICVTSIINTTEIDQTVELPCVIFQGLDENESALTLTLKADSGNEFRLSNLRNQLGLDHLSSEERHPL
jgi:hypothetical protein